jgi:hypothetical protein
MISGFHDSPVLLRIMVLGDGDSKDVWNIGSMHCDITQKQDPHYVWSINLLWWLLLVTTLNTSCIKIIISKDCKESSLFWYMEQKFGLQQRKM